MSSDNIACRVASFSNLPLSIFLINATINNLLHTRLDIGLPGKQKIIFLPSLPMIIGFPGLMGIPSTSIFIPSLM